MRFSTDRASGVLAPWRSPHDHHLGQKVAPRGAELGSPVMQKVGTPGSGLEHNDYCSTGRLVIWMKGAPSVIVAVRVPISPPIVVAVRAIIQMDTKVVPVPTFAPLVLTPFIRAAN
jgi:hypothetical protein